MASKTSNITVAVVGKTGSGKSSLCNALLQTDLFKVATGATSQTVQYSSHTKTVYHKQLTVIDTPDVLALIENNQIEHEADNFIKLCSNGVNAFLLVIECGRFTPESRDTVEAMASMFGDCVYDFMIVVFSKADYFDSDEEFKQHIEEAKRNSQYLCDMLHRCGDRVAHVDNGRRCKKDLQQKQLKFILDLVEQMGKKTNKSHNKQYTMEIYQQAQIELQQRLRNKKEEKISDEQREQRVAELQEQQKELMQKQQQQQQKQQQQKQKHQHQVGKDQQKNHQELHNASQQEQNQNRQLVDNERQQSQTTHTSPAGNSESNSEVDSCHVEYRQFKEEFNKIINKDDPRLWRGLAVQLLKNYKRLEMENQKLRRKNPRSENN